MSKENQLEVEDDLSKKNKSSEELEEKFNENNENDNSDNIILKEKIDELKYFDAVSHFK